MPLLFPTELWMQESMPTSGDVVVVVTVEVVAVVVVVVVVVVEVPVTVVSVAVVTVAVVAVAVVSVAVVSVVDVAVLVVVVVVLVVDVVVMPHPNAPRCHSAISWLIDETPTSHRPCACAELESESGPNGKLDDLKAPPKLTHSSPSTSSDAVTKPMSLLTARSVAPHFAPDTALTSVNPASVGSAPHATSAFLSRNPGLTSWHF